MAINNYINLQRNDFFSPYLDGVANLKMAFSPESTTNIYNSARTITLIPFSPADRVCHFISGIGLLIPVVNLVISCALRYFASRNLPALRSPTSTPAENRPVIARPQVAPVASAAEARLAAILTDSDEEEESVPVGSRSLAAALALINTDSDDQAGSLPDTASAQELAVADTTQNERHVPAQAASPVAAESTPERNLLQPAPPYVLASSTALCRVASRRAERLSQTATELPQIAEEDEEIEGSPDMASVASTAQRFSHGAGVILYRFHLREVEILIGRNREGGNWSYFGGESMEGEPPMHTAARKCEEVTGGFLGRQEDILPHLNESDRIGGAYKTYFIHVEDPSITAERFLQPRKAVAKTQIAWVKIHDLLSVARQSNNRLKIEGIQAELHPSFRATFLHSSSQDVLRRIASLQSGAVLRKVPSFASTGFRSVA
ncbi:MAG: hypothetical protein NTX49_07310 [Chlamydiae bacterium]|nr:hypothetical protein [Chlamydiota bacterium]